jgi:hypothetical protein
LIYAQKSPVKFGEISIEDLKMKRYAKDTMASAVIIFDKGETSLNEDLRVEFKRHTRIKFLTKAAIDEWATKTIMLSHNEDGISKLKGIT